MRCVACGRQVRSGEDLCPRCRLTAREIAGTTGPDSDRTIDLAPTGADFSTGADSPMSGVDARLLQCFSRYRDAVLRLNGVPRRSSDVEAALARLQLWRCLIRLGWHPPDDVAAEIAATGPGGAGDAR